MKRWERREKQAKEHSSSAIEALCNELRSFVERGDSFPEVDRALITLLVVERLEQDDLSTTKTDTHAEPPSRWMLTARKYLEEHQGREVSINQYELVAVFDGPEKAIRCGRAILDSNEARSLRMRAGVYSREHDLWRDGTDDTSVRLGRAIAQHGALGDVITTKGVADVIAGSRIPLSPRGAHALFGLTGLWTLFASSQE